MTGRLLRSHLYIPADRERFVAKARSTGADAVILDLEDSVVESRKEAALDAALTFLAEPADDGPERWVRVNAGDRGLAEIEVLIAARPDGVWLPKAEPGGWTADAVAALTAAGVRPGVMIESATGLVGLPQLPPLPPNALTQLGEVDLAADLRMRDRSEESMVPFRARIVLETAIRRLPMPVAPVDDRYDDLDEYRRRCELLRDRGFGSRACIHPAQVTIVNEVFALDADDVERARRIVAAFDEAAADGRGAYVDEDGRMADLATVRWARDLLSRVETSGA
jgi:citrate lyase beta subunit